MNKRLDSYDWEQAFGESGSHNDTPAPDIVPPGAKVSGERVTRGDVAEIIAIEDGENDGESWVGVFLLHDGRYAAVEGSCDYTGWDCQSGTTVTVAASVTDAVRFGLSMEGRARLGLQLPEEKSVPQ